MAKSSFFKAPIRTIEGLSGPALLVLLTAAIGAVIVLMPADVIAVSPNGQVTKVRPSFWDRLLTVLITQLPVAVIMVYTFQCMVVGHCATWAWFWAALLFVFQILAVLGLIVMRTA
jgi:hypothetical protein